jgi:hypothetical protein
VNEAGSVARQVWQEFSPREGEQLTCRDDGIIEVAIDGEQEGFGIDPDVPLSLYVSIMADRIQTNRCPPHPTGARLIRHTSLTSRSVKLMCAASTTDGH